eukprot:CAMPEP_0181338950 /NCGR_PEP_ID=MMETSP1101-20121128/28945_1 /TAXON_ID=46948 /ORGANISM="Rhodomonas abbreviata, Strain Caron Lab Isolate" /LENGTH=276 /DNA_ID=CAMNT_0023449785 /DNA_START=73 /DNA_END=900 /DNA_ORIENTATION=+
MLVLLVRHAESENNIVQAQVHGKLQRRELNPVEAQELWLSERFPDPDLSVNGVKQAAKLKKHMKTVARHGIDKYVMFSSPMKRACQTARVISDALSLPVELKPELCEVGGIYKAVKQMQHGVIPVVLKVAGEARSAQDIKNEHPNFNTSNLPPHGPWDGVRGFESTDDAVNRASYVANWLKSVDLQQQVGERGCVIIVSHADFLALLISVIQGQRPLSTRDNPDSEMSTHGVTEAALLKQMPGGSTVESVYAKYRISLCSSCFFSMHADNVQNFIW